MGPGKANAPNLLVPVRGESDNEMKLYKSSLVGDARVLIKGRKSTLITIAHVNNRVNFSVYTRSRVNDAIRSETREKIRFKTTIMQISYWHMASKMRKKFLGIILHP